MDATVVHLRPATSGPTALRTLTRRLGEGAGVLAAPFFAATSALRRARTFHPRGDCVDAVAATHPAALPPHRELAARLAGPVFVRFSDALTKGKARWPDVLGCALRFGRSPRAEGGDQDLLFATIKRPWTMAFAPFTTRVGDYLGNDYFAVSPFHVEGLGRVWLRLRPERPRGTALRDGGPSARRLRLEDDISRGGATLALGVADDPWGPFLPVVRIELSSPRRADVPGLRFDPFRNGRGVVPVGFVHGLRRAAYAGSQLARP